MARTWTTTKAVVAGTLMLAVSVPAASVSAEAVPQYIPVDADWLTTVNYFREMADLPPVTEDTAMSTGAYQHSCYMLQNGIAHDELPSKPGYTPEGDAAGNTGNVAVSSAYGASARSHIELWMTGPFHAIGVLRPNLQTRRLRQVRQPGDVAVAVGGDPRRAARSRRRDPAVVADPVPRQRLDDQSEPVHRRVARPAVVLRLDRQCRSAGDRDDARRRQRRRERHDHRVLTARSRRAPSRS